jgi:hypothetical protein
MIRKPARGPSRTVCPGGGSEPTECSKLWPRGNAVRNRKATPREKKTPLSVVSKVLPRAVPTAKERFLLEFLCGLLPL